MNAPITYKKLVWLVVIAIVLYCGLTNYTLVLRILGYVANLIFPFALGGAIAFIINVPMRAIERRLWQNSDKRTSLRRVCAYLITLFLILGIIVLALFVIIPQVSETLKQIIALIPNAFTAFQAWLYRTTANLPNVQSYIDELNLNWSSLSSYAINLLKNISGAFFTSGITIVSGIISTVTTFFIAFVFSIYVLFQKEKLSRQTKQTLYALCSEKAADKIIYIGRLSNKIFSNFLSGQCIEAVILGLMFFVTLSILRFPYAVLIGVVIAITALIPIFGAFIGCAIGVFLIVMVNPMQALWFIIIFLILQQIEGNLIYPHVVGSSVGLPSVWVLVAVTVGGSLLGIAGILLFIPFCSVCYALLRESILNRLQQKNVSREKWSGEVEGAQGQVSGQMTEQVEAAVDAQAEAQVDNSRLQSEDGEREER